MLSVWVAVIAAALLLIAHGGLAYLVYGDPGVNSALIMMGFIVISVVAIAVGIVYFTYVSQKSHRSSRKG